MSGFRVDLSGMGSKVYRIEHLKANELYHRYREDKDPIKRTHLQIIWLLTRGRPAKVAAEMTGYSQCWISVLVGRYNEAGVDGLGDLRRFNPGSRPLLDAEKLERLDRALDDPPPDGGLWTGRRVAQWICGLLGRLVSPRRGLEYLRRLGFTRQVPRPRHAQGDFAAQERFKADFRARMEELAREAPSRSVQIWAFDEHRAGLKPILRKVWARRGQRPLARGHQRFQWVYVFGFVRPATGDVVWFLADAVNTARFSAILAAFARDVGAGPDNIVVLVLDGAGWHVASDLVIPDGIRLEFLPPYSPELQPAEPLWPLINEPLAKQHFHTLADLDQVLGERCCHLADDHDRIRASTQFHWWPAFI
jgi:transposase